MNKLPNTSVVLDVREEWETPKVKNKSVISIPLDELNDRIDEIASDKPIYVLCQKGGRSQVAIDFLKSEYNYTNLVNVDGGIG